MVAKHEVSVVIACSNHGEFLDEAVRSALSQSRPPLEVLVVDDGSTDRATVDVLEGASWPRARVLRLPSNVGPGPARNRGVAEARGEYLCFLDADDRLAPEHLEATCALLDGDAEGRIGFVTTDIRYFGDEDHVWRTPLTGPVGWALGCPAHIGSPLRRAVFDAVGGFGDMPVAVDWDLWLHILAAGYEWRHVAETTYHYRRHGTSVSEHFRAAPADVYRILVERNRDWFRAHELEVLAALFERSFSLDEAWREKEVARAAERRAAERCTHAETERAALEQALQASRDEVDKLAADREAMERALLASRDEVRAVAVDREAMEQALLASRDEVAAVAVDRAGMEKALLASREEVRAVAVDRVAMEQALLASRAEVDELAADRAGLEQALLASRAEVAELEGEIERLARLERERDGAYKRLETHAEHLMAELTAAKEAYSRLEEHVLESMPDATEPDASG